MDFVSSVEKKDTCQENVQRRNSTRKGKVDSKEERREDPAVIITFKPHPMMVTMTVVQKEKKSRSLSQITPKMSEP